MMDFMKKGNKKVIIIIVAIALIVGMGGYMLYAQDMRHKVDETLSAYHSIIMPDYSQYNEDEKIEYIRITDAHKTAFEQLDYMMLKEIPQQYQVLHTTSEQRVESEHVTKQYADKYEEVEAYLLVEGANDDETHIFNERKEQLRVLVENRDTFDAIEAKFVELRGTNTDIDVKKQANADAEAERVNSYTGGDSGSSGSAQSSGGTSGGTGGGGTYSPPPAPAPSGGGGSPEVCRTRPDGSQLCTGGNW